MPTTSRTTKKVVKPTVVFAGDLHGQALLSDMHSYKDKVTASPAAARNFLVELGVLTTQGKAKRLIRG